MASGIDYDQLDEQDRWILQQNETQPQDPPDTGYTNLYVYNPPPPLQSSQPEPYIEELSAASPAYIATPADRTSHEAVEDTESVPRTAATNKASGPKKPTKKRKRTPQPTPNKQNASSRLGQDIIVDFTTKKQKSRPSEEQCSTLADSRSRATSQEHVPILSIEQSDTNEQDIVFVNTNTLTELPSKQADLSTHHAAGSSLTREQPQALMSASLAMNTNEWMSHISKLVNQHPALEERTKTLAKEVQDLRSRASEFDVLSKNVKGLGTDYDNLQRNILEAKRDADENFKDVKRLQTDQGASLQALQTVSTALQDKAMKLCRDYEKKNQELEASSERLSEQLSEKVGLLSEERDRNAQLHRELTAQVSKWDGLADDFIRATKSVEGTDLRNDEAFKGIRVMISDLEKTVSGGQSADNETRAHILGHLEEVEEGVVGLVSDRATQVQETAKSIEKLNNSLLEKLNAVVDDVQEHRENASHSAKVSELSSRIAALTEEKAQLEKDLDIAKNNDYVLSAQAKASYSAEISELNSKIAALTDEKAQLKIELNTAIKDAAVLSGKTNSSHDTLVSILNSKIAVLEDEKTKLKKDLGTANHELTTLRVNIGIQTDKDARMQRENKQLRNRLDEIDRAPVADFSEREKALEEQRIADLEKLKLEMSSEFQKLAYRHNANVANKIRGLEYDNLKIQERHNIMTQAHTKLTNGMSTLTQARDKLKENLAEATEAKDKITSDLAKTTLAKNKLTEDLNTANQAKDKLTDDYNAAKQANGHLDSQLEEAKRANVECQQKLQQVEARLGTFENQQPLLYLDDLPNDTSIEMPIEVRNEVSDEMFNDMPIEIPTSELSEPALSDSVGQLEEQASQRVAPRPNSASKRQPSVVIGRPIRSTRKSAAGSVIGVSENDFEEIENPIDDEQNSLYLDSQSQLARATKSKQKPTRRPATRASKSDRYGTRSNQELRN